MIIEHARSHKQTHTRTQPAAKVDKVGTIWCVGTCTVPPISINLLISIAVHWAAYENHWLLLLLYAVYLYLTRCTFKVLVPSTYIAIPTNCSPYLLLYLLKNSFVFRVKHRRMCTRFECVVLRSSRFSITLYPSRPNQLHTKIKATKNGQFKRLHVPLWICVTILRELK